MKSFGLSTIELDVSFGIVANEGLAERRVHVLDVSREIASVLEGELLLAAALYGTRGHQAAGVRVAQDFASELLVDQKCGGVSGHIGL